MKPLKIDEQELLKLLNKREEAGFKYLYENYSGSLTSVIGRIITDEGIAEDILQETFVLIWNNIGRYERSKGRLFTWMVTIAKNLSIDTLRSKAFRNLAKHHDLDFADEQHAERTGVHMFDHIGLKNKLQHLDPEYKLLIDMAYFHGFSYTEIAEQLNMPLGTVKTRIRRAVLALNRLLQDKEG